MSTENKTEEYIDVVVKLEIKGQFVGGWEKTYKRGRETGCFDLEDFARVVFIYEKLLNAGSTYAMDGLMQEAEKHLPKKEGVTAESVFQKYWVNYAKTATEDFEKYNAGNADGNFPYPVENDYLKSCVMHMGRAFLENALPVKYAYIYWLFKYVFGESCEELLKDYNQVPDYLKEVVDNIVKK